MYTENTGKHHRNGLPVWLLPLLVVISFWGVSQNIMVVDASSAVTVLPGNGGTLPLVNQLVIKQNDTALQGITNNAGDRGSLTPKNGAQRLLIHKVKDSDTITSTYGTVGTFHGQEVTAKVTISHIKVHDDSHKAPSGMKQTDGAFQIGPGFSSDTTMSNVAQFNVSYEFYYADTHAAVNIQNAFITLSSLDGPVAGTSTGFEYTAYLGAGKIYTVENSIVKQIANPLGGGQLVMAGQTARDASWPYTSSTAATFGVSGTKLEFIYGTTRVNSGNSWLQPVYNVSTITLGTPAIATPTLSATQSATDKQNRTLTYDLQQKVNVLDQDLMTKYKDWSENITIPTNAKYAKGEVINDAGQALPSTAYQVSYDEKTHQVKWHLTDAGIKSLPFKGETYHFKAQVQFSDDVDDQTKVTATGQTAIDKQTKTSNTGTNTIDNQATITVHHYMTDSTDKVAPDETVKVGYGKAYDVTKQVKTITGYKRNATLDEHTRGTASKTTKEAVMYYDPLPYNIHVNYLLTDGQKLDELDVTGLYGDTYTTEATDFEDLYTVDTDRLPTNAQGTVTEKPTTVNYYYQPTTGQWVDVGNQSSVLVQQDTKHNVRSVSQIYANDSGFTVKYNQDAAQVAIAASDTNGTQDNSLVFDYNSKYTFELSKNETVTFKVDDQGQVTATRVLGAEQTVTTFDKSGQLKTVTTVTNANGTKSQQTNTVDGLKSMVTGEQYDLGLLNGLKVTAQKEINPSQAATTESKTTTDTSQSGSNQSTSTTATDQTETNESTAGSSTNATNASSSVDASSANSQGDTEATSQSGTSASADSKTDSSVASSTSQTTDGKTDGETTNTGDTTTGTTTDSGLGFKSPFTEDQNTSSALGSAQTSSSLNSDTSAAVQALIAEPNSTPVVLGEDASFEEGVPVNDPVFSNDEGVSPNNNPSSAATPLAQATNTRARLTQNGKLLYEGTLQADQGEQNLYVSPDTTVEVDGGADGDGFYLDTYDGDKGMAYTLGSGYAWAAENNDVTAAPASSATTSSESAAIESSTNSSDSSRTASSAADHSTSSASISDASQSSHSTSSSENSRSESSSSSSTTGDSADADKQAAARSSQTQSNSVNGSSQAVSASTVTSQSSVPTKANTKQASSTPTTKANRATVAAATSSTAPRQSRATTAGASVPSVTSASAAAASRAKQRSAFKKQHPILNQILPKTNSAVATWLVWLGVGLLLLTVAITMVIKKRGRD